MTNVIASVHIQINLTEVFCSVAIAFAKQHSVELNHNLRTEHTSTGEFHVGSTKGVSFGRNLTLDLSSRPGMNL